MTCLIASLHKNFSLLGFSTIDHKQSGHFTLGNVHHLVKISAGVDDVKATNVAKMYTKLLDSCEVKIGNYLL